MTFGERLEKLRRRRKRTASSVAAAVGISAVYYRDIERGRRGAPTRDALRQGIYVSLGLTEGEMAKLEGMVGGVK